MTQARGANVDKDAMTTVMVSANRSGAGIWPKVLICRKYNLLSERA